MNTLKGILLVLILSITTATFGKSIVCKNSRMGKTFIIKKQSVALYEDSVDAGAGRAVASINSVRTKIRGKSLTKTMRFEGNRLSLHIHNIDAPNSIDDYMSLRSRAGHEIIYPIECSVK